ncbi:MAG: cytochrome c [Alphaproteobacteria bacterium]|nr:cytochrome c [Alphaproteobacteria bacterium]
MISVALSFAATPKEDKKNWPDAERGKALAERLCVNCHVVSQDSATDVPDGVPTFKGIANKSKQSAEHIRNILMQPHAPMPNMNLSRLEMDDIIAYLDELRLDKSGTPLLPNLKNRGAIPEYPEPS